MLKNLCCLLIAMCAFVWVDAQTVDEILAQVHENTGGIDNWKSMKTRKTIAKMGMQGMEFQGTIYEKYPNKQRMEIDIQGMQLVQAYDGETAWWINPMQGGTEAQKMPDAMAEQMTSQKFESEFIDYADKGHTVELLGTKEIDGVECFELKLSLENGDVQHHFVDTENFVVIMFKMSVKTGPAQGMEAETYLSDYQEIDGLMIPHDIEAKVNGQVMQKITVESIALNPELEDSFFAYPKKTEKSKDMGKEGDKEKKSGN